MSRSRSRSVLVLLVICMAQFMVVADDTIVNTALPSIGRDLGLSERSLAWVVNAYLLLFGGFLLLGGRAADVLGRRRMFLVGLALFTLVSAVCGLARSDELLVGARGLQGLAGALLSPAALAILVTTFAEGPARTRALGVWAALLGLGAATGLLAGGAITETIGWRWVFFVNVPIGLAVLAASLRLLPADPGRRERATLDVPGAVLVTGGLLAIVYSVVESHEQGWTSALTLGGLAAGAVLLVAFALREGRAGDPLVPPRLVRRRSVSVSNAIMAFAAAGMFAMFFFVSLYMQLVHGWSPLRAGVSFLAFTFAFGLTSGVATKLMPRVGPRAMLAVGLLAAASGMLVLSRLGVDAGYWSALAPALALAGVGMGLGFVPLTAVATGGVAGRDAGIVSGLLSTCQQVGGAVGIAVLVTIASERTADVVAAGGGQAAALTEGFQAAFVVNGAMLLATIVLVPLLGRARVRAVTVPA